MVDGSVTCSRRWRRRTHGPRPSQPPAARSQGIGLHLCAVLFIWAGPGVGFQCWLLAAGRSSLLLRHRHLRPTPSPLFAEMALGNQRRVGGGEMPPATAIPWFRLMGIGRHYCHAHSHQTPSVDLDIPRVHLSPMEALAGQGLLISVALSVLWFNWGLVSVEHLCITVQSATPSPCREVYVTIPGDLGVLWAQQEPLQPGPSCSHPAGLGELSEIL